MYNYTYQAYANFMCTKYMHTYACRVTPGMTYYEHLQ